VKFIILILCTLVLTACGGGGNTTLTTSDIPIQAPTEFPTHAPTDPLKIDPNKYSVASIPPGPIYNMQVGDVNGDGLDDVVVTGWSRVAPTSYVYIYIQNANGTLTDQTSTLLPNNTIPGANHILIHDFDGDGHADIFLPGYSEDNAGQVAVTSIMLWGSSTTFSRQVWDINLAAGACMADFNNDGKMDLMVAGGGFTPQHEVGGIYLNTGTQTKFILQANGILGDNGFSACAPIKSGNNTVVYMGNNTYNPLQDRIITLDNNLNIINQSLVAINGNYYTIDATAVDLNNDGNIDFVIEQNDNLGSMDGVGPKLYYQNNGNGFNAPTTLTTALSGSYSRALSIGGVPSIFFAGYTSNVRVFKGFSQIYNTQFTTMAGTIPAQDVADIYQNSTTGKVYMIQLLNGSVLTQEMQ